MEIAALWIALSVIVGVAAHARGRSAVAWVVVSLFISPVLSLILVLVMNRVDAPSTSEEPKDAPFIDPGYRRPNDWKSS
jgi:hypothetical protein